MRIRAYLLLVLLLSASGLAPAAAVDSPRLQLRDLDGSARSLAEFRGNIVVVNFWATWCVPCRTEMPMLARVARAYRSRDVVVVGASTDLVETRHAIPPLLHEAKVEFPIWVGATTDHMHRFGLGDALPATAIIDQRGQVAYRILGALTEHDLTQRLDVLLSESGEAPVARLVTTSTPEGGDDHPHDGAGGPPHDHDHAHTHTGGHAHAAGTSMDPSLVPS